MDTAAVAGPPLDSIRAARLALVGREAVQATSFSSSSFHLSFLACIRVFVWVPSGCLRSLKEFGGVRHDGNNWVL